MVDQRRDADLDARLRDLGTALAYPQPAQLPERVTARIVAEPRPASRAFRLGRPTRGLILAVALLLLLAAAVAAVGLGLSGLRIVFSSPSPSPGTALPSATVPLSGLPTGLGLEVEPEAAAGLVGFDPALPPGLPPPDAAFVAGRRLTLVWRPGPALPEMDAIGAGLVLTEFRGGVDPGWYEKIVDARLATVEPTTVAGAPAYWISGQPHILVYRDEDGDYLEDSRRVVGDVLIWEAAGVTYRIESALGRDGAIDLAMSMTPVP